MGISGLPGSYRYFQSTKYIIILYSYRCMCSTKNVLLLVLLSDHPEIISYESTSLFIESFVLIVDFNKLRYCSGSYS